MNFLLSRQAETSLEQLWDYYYERGGTNLADRILADIHDAIAHVVEHPNLGHFRPDLTDKPFRFYRVYRIFLIYDPAASPIYIARIYHSARDIERRMKTDPD